MLVSILSWIYMGYVCLVIGFSIIRLLEKVLKCTFQSRNGMHDLITGVVAVTVCVEYFSLIYKIGMLVHLIMLLSVVLISWFFRKEFLVLLKQLRKTAFSWEGFFYLCAVLFFAFFASRGDFHTDTGIYHGQAIRWFEEYGAVKGQGNLQLHYAYNSAYLAFASIFSMFWLFGISLHTTTGFLAIVMCIYACSGLKGIRSRRSYYGDFCRIGILIYLLNILCRIMSPATDFGTQMMAPYLLLRWVELFETRGSGPEAKGSLLKAEYRESVTKNSIQDYALLSVFAVFIVTLKLSAVSLLLLACFPAWYLIKGKEWRKIIGYIALGLLILLPYLLRNIILSGWLIYPFAGIDLFSFDWKIPKEYLEIDSAQITVWGRCLYDIGKIDTPLSEWLPIWWGEQTRYGKMLIYANILGAALAAFLFIRKKRNRKKSSGALTFLYAALIASLFLWFMMAPFIRYGLAFLLMLPLLAMAEALSLEQKGLAQIMTGILTVGIFFSISPFWDNYITDAGVFMKQNIREPYYIIPKDYDRPPTEVIKMGEFDFYIPVGSGEFMSYYDFPGSCYSDMIERSEMRGESIRDGFRARE